MEIVFVIHSKIIYTIKDTEKLCNDEKYTMKLPCQRKVGMGSDIDLHCFPHTLNFVLLHFVLLIFDNFQNSIIVKINLQEIRRELHHHSNIVYILIDGP